MYEQTQTPATRRETPAQSAPESSEQDQYRVAWRHILTGSLERGCFLVAALCRKDPTPFFTYSKHDDIAEAQRIYAKIKMLGDLGPGSLNPYPKITPALAKTMLRYNDGNRNIVAANLKATILAFREGKFAVNGEAIIIANNGHLNDGQHRLLACALTGITFESALSYGVEPETKATVDIGIGRRPGDRLSMKGIRSGHAVAALNGFAFEVLQGEKPSALQRDEFFEADPDRLVKAFEMTLTSRPKPILNQWNDTAIGTAVYLLMRNGVEVETIQQFLDRLKTGAALSTGNPILTFRNALSGNKKIQRYDLVRGTIAHFQAFRRGKSLRSLTFEGGLESVGVTLRDKMKLQPIGVR